MTKKRMCPVPVGPLMVPTWRDRRCVGDRGAAAVPASAQSRAIKYFLSTPYLPLSIIASSSTRGAES